MDTLAIISAILTLTAGIGVFLVACQMMSSNLESASSKRLKRMFNQASKGGGSGWLQRWLGVGIGTVGTAAIQSSGAVTVMVIGFVNVGIMSLTQAAAVIYGSNIGTTVTAQLVALGMFGANSISTNLIFAAFAGIGAFMMLFGKTDGWKMTGGIITGFGLLFVGLNMMSHSMTDFAALEGVRLFLASIQNPFLLVVVGAVLTAIIQSSSVMTSVAITMVVAGLIALDQGIYLTMGSNIGSCVVAILAGWTSGTNAKRTAMIHLLFNTMGVVIFMLIAWGMWLVTKGSMSFSTLFADFFPHAPQVQLAMFHTVFNVCTMLVAMPLTNGLVNISCRLIKDKPKVAEPDAPHFYFLDEQMLRTPVVAVRQLKAEIENMSLLAITNFRRAIKIVTTLDYTEIEDFRKTEKELNFLNRELVRYSVLLSGKQLNDYDHQYLVSTIRTVSDLERIGDYAENIVEYADSLQKQDAQFSGYALKEIWHMEELINALYEATMQAYHKLDLSALGRANQIEDDIDQLTDEMERNHIQRLALDICNPQVGTEYISLAQNAERIADHFINVAKTIRDLIPNAQYNQ
ncbi:MAG: Na/Pi cotransporter family protein [Paludibacteraceae bacterium]|nr:Na/Pi cotransporter family protein [Paludibacteraceae bacterium]MBQ2190061.1 Na/Pi cotransporter family protein [Paludibacteraceae bacterium]